MSQYLLWNPSKVSQYGGRADNYDELVQTEIEQECSWSSIIMTDNIDLIVQAIENECDVSISYKKLSKA